MGYQYKDVNHYPLSAPQLRSSGPLGYCSLSCFWFGTVPCISLWFLFVCIYLMRINLRISHCSLWYFYFAYISVSQCIQGDAVDPHLLYHRVNTWLVCIYFCLKLTLQSAHLDLSEWSISTSLLVNKGDVIYFCISSFLYCICCTLVCVSCHCQYSADVFRFFVFRYCE